MDLLKPFNSSTFQTIQWIIQKPMSWFWWMNFVEDLLNNQLLHNWIKSNGNESALDVANQSERRSKRFINCRNRFLNFIIPAVLWWTCSSSSSIQQHLKMTLSHRNWLFLSLTSQSETTIYYPAIKRLINVNKESIAPVSIIPMQSKLMDVGKWALFKQR